MSITETIETHSASTVTIPKTLDYQAVAAHFGVTPITISRWVKSGQLPPPIRIGSKQFWTAETIARLFDPVMVAGE